MRLRVLPVADVNLLNLDVILTELAALLPLSVGAGFLAIQERMIELDRCVPGFLLLKLDIQAGIVLLGV